VRFFKFSLVLALFMFLSACVSNIESTAPKVDKQKALEAHVKLGMNYLQKGDRDRAQRSFTKAQELDYKSAEAMQGIALVHQINGELDLAEEKFKKALKLRADFSMASIELSYARFLYKAARYDEALGYLVAASGDINYPSRVNALYLLGLCSLELSDRVRAVGSFEHALNISPRFAPAAIELAELSFEDRSYPDAKKYLDAYGANARQSARSLWLGIRLERIFGNKDKEASYALALKNLHPYSKEYLDYKNSLKKTN